MANEPTKPVAGATSLSDILTAIQHLVQALNNASQVYRQVQGISTAEGLTAATVVKATPGRVASVSVIVAGSATGTIYDSSATSVPTAPLYKIPNTVGVVFVNLPTDTGIMVVPGTGQTVTVSWS